MFKLISMVNKNGVNNNSRELTMTTSTKSKLKQVHRNFNITFVFMWCRNKIWKKRTKKVTSGYTLQKVSKKIKLKKFFTLMLLLLLHKGEKHIRIQFVSLKANQETRLESAKKWIPLEKSDFRIFIRHSCR